MRASPWSWHLRIELSLLGTVKRQNKDIFFPFPARRSDLNWRQETWNYTPRTSRSFDRSRSDLWFNMAAFTFFERWQPQSRALDKISSKSQAWVIMWKDVLWWLACQGAPWGLGRRNFGRQDKEATVPFQRIYFSLTSIALVLSDLCGFGLAWR